jgi:hypothetical protein
MTRDDIIRMAREAGFEEYEWSSLSGESELDETLQVGEYPVGEAVFKFAALVAAAEREACAGLCEWKTGIRPVDAAIETCAAAIRARGETK